MRTLPGAEVSAPVAPRILTGAGPTASGRYLVDGGSVELRHGER